MKCVVLFVTLLGVPVLSASYVRVGDSIRFVETENARMIVRLIPIDAGGVEVGSGRVIVLRPLEEREVVLRDEFDSAVLRDHEIRVEVLQSGGRRRAVGRGAPAPAPRPSSESLIDAAEAAGTIGMETAVIYRLYALFGDARLPAAYRGDDSKVREAMYVNDVRARFETFSETTRNTVAPFIIPPAYEGSWASSIGDEPSALYGVPPTCADLSVKWGWVDATSPVRIWFRRSANDEARARSLASAIDATIWPKFTALMTGHVPLDDSEELQCNGGDARLDIYLVDMANLGCALGFSGCSESPAFILLNRGASDAVAAHEIFHAFQFSYELDSGCLTDSNYRWWTEGSADWAMDYAFSGVPDEEHSSASQLLDVPHLELDLNATDHVYGTYLLPFYMHRSTNSAAVVSNAWLNCEDDKALEAVDKAIGGFENIWPDFVRYNYNDGKFNEYEKWDRLRTRAALVDNFPKTVTLGGPDDVDIIKVDLPRLSAIYRAYHFNKDDNVRTVAFFNGVTFKLDLKEIPLAGVQYVPSPASEDQKKGARVQALIKLQGQEWTFEDWTDRPFVTFCRDMLAERLEKLVIIISNHEFEDRGRRLKTEGGLPILWTSNMGCWRWKGTANFTHSSEAVSATISTEVTWTREGDSTQTMPTVAYAATGKETWTLKVTQPPPAPKCEASGSLDIGGFYTLKSYNYIPTQSTYHRSYVGAGTETRIFPACGSQTTLFPWLLNPLQPFVPGIPEARFLTVSADGTVMEGTHSPKTAPGSTWKWRFVAERER